ncbi:MAG: YitT family protein [Nevskiaceae bacterium]|nr:MAG: YitT family protein [Nevskiaceae bacterium]
MSDESPEPSQLLPALEQEVEAIVPEPHSLLDDVQGFLMGGMLSAMGVVLLSACGLMTGGTAGLAFFLHYLTGWGIGLVFFLINLPFFLLAIRRMGWLFTFKSFLSVSLLSLLVDLMPRYLSFAHVNTAFGAVAGGMLLGMGVLAFVRHGSSLGGINILAVYLQKSRGLRAGHIQIAVDAGLTIGALFVLEPRQVLYSGLGALVLGAVLAFNHKPGRYMGV